MSHSPRSPAATRAETLLHANLIGNGARAHPTANTDTLDFDGLGADFTVHTYSVLQGSSGCMSRAMLPATR